MGSKTISVEKVVASGNQSLRHSTCTPQIRQGIINLMEFVLHESGNYKGFRYLTKDEVPHDQKPGINMRPDGEMFSSLDDRFADTDNTRVQYS